jgi:hypothetical protein
MSRVLPVGPRMFREVSGGSGRYLEVQGGFLEVPGGSGRFREAPGGSGRYLEVQGGSGRFREAPGGSGRYLEVQGGSGRLREAPGGTGRYREVPGGSGRFREVPGGSGMPALFERPPSDSAVELVVSFGGDGALLGRVVGNPRGRQQRGGILGGISDDAPGKERSCRRKGWKMPLEDVCKLLTEVSGTLWTFRLF